MRPFGDVEFLGLSACGPGFPNVRVRWGSVETDDEFGSVPRVEVRLSMAIILLQAVTERGGRAGGRIPRSDELERHHVAFADALAGDEVLVAGPEALGEVVLAVSLDRPAPGARVPRNAGRPAPSQAADSALLIQTRHYGRRSLSGLITSSVAGVAGVTRVLL
jgi:hypothetical protein